jgi:penicillin-binding protein 2
MEQENPVDIQRRLPFFAAFIVVFILVLFTRLWFLQVVKGDYYYDLAENNRIRPIKIRPPRGIIYDRYGRPLVENVLTFDISIVPEDAQDINATINKTASLLKMNAGSIRSSLDDAADTRTKYEPVKIREEAPWEAVAIVESHQDELPGVIVEPEHRRHYPYGGLGSHQLGYIGKVSPAQRKKEQAELSLLIGQGGIEKTYDKFLRGASGRRMIQVNASGTKVKDLGIEDPKPGMDLYLTIDLDAQRAAEEALGDRAGAVVAMDPNNGEVLTLVSHPNFDPNLFPRGISPKDWVKLANDPSHPLYNRAIQSVYPPGSTFKVVVSLAGLDSGAIKLDDKVTCGGFIKSGKHAFRCWKKEGHGTLSYHRGLVESCDVYFYTMGERIGFDRIARYAQNLGLGAITGIKLPDEKPGFIPTSAWKKDRLREPWYPGDTYINSIGQGFIQVSPIQACQLIGAVANGGLFYRPNLVLQTRNRGTGTVKLTSPERKGRVVLDSAALEEVRKALIGVVSEPGGTGHGAQNPIATVAGKTGTAQVIAQKDPGTKLFGKTQDLAGFFAYAPIENPRIAVAVLVEHGGHGGGAAAPIARRVIEEYMKNVVSKMVQ